LQENELAEHGPRPYFVNSKNVPHTVVEIQYKKKKADNTYEYQVGYMRPENTRSRTVNKSKIYYGTVQEDKFRDIDINLLRQVDDYKTYKKLNANVLFCYNLASKVLLNVKIPYNSKNTYDDKPAVIDLKRERDERKKEHAKIKCVECLKDGPRKSPKDSVFITCEKQ